MVQSRILHHRRWWARLLLRMLGGRTQMSLRLVGWRTMKRRWRRILRRPRRRRFHFPILLLLLGLQRKYLCLHRRLLRLRMTERSRIHRRVHSCWASFLLRMGWAVKQGGTMPTLLGRVGRRMRKRRSRHTLHRLRCRRCPSCLMHWLS